MKTLDVSRLPTQARYRTDGEQIDLATVVTKLRTSVREMGLHGLVKPVKSFGCAVGRPLDTGGVNWKNPYEFVWFVAGWGPDKDRYIANAVRKLRATVRTGDATLLMREEGSRAFKKPVASQEDDGSFKWGDFPWGGGVMSHVGFNVIPVGVSCFSEVEDHAVAHLVGGLIGGEMLKLDKPSEFGPKS